MIDNRDTLYSKIYDQFYSQFAKQAKYKITNKTKVNIIANIFEHMSLSDQIAIRSAIVYHYNFELAAKNLNGMSKKKLSQQYETAVFHMYYPSNISLAVPKYYKVNTKTKNPHIVLKESDFGGNKYIITALEKKSGIIYREQLLKHLSNGYLFLWTLPGCGDKARRSILMAIDKWNGIDNIGERLHLPSIKRLKKGEKLIKRY